MSLITLILVLVVVGVLLWLVNAYIGPRMHPTILAILNVAVIIFVILWLLQVFGLIDSLRTIRIQ